MSRIHASKRRRLSPPEDHVAGSPPSKAHPSFVANAGKWDLEQEYEQRPRKQKKKKENTKLPIRTTEGWVEQANTAGEVKQEDSESDSFLGSGSEHEDDDDDADKKEAEVVEAKPQIPVRQQVVQAKEELAKIASLINEDPEEHIGALKSLANYATTDVPAIQKLAMATQVAIYKDLIPGYRIKPLSEEGSEKVSKEVKKLRNFEQKLVSGYQNFIKDLDRLSKPGGSKSESASSLRTVAISCACNLLLAVPHFNFRGELLNILIRKLSTRQMDDDFVKCKTTLETLFETDEDGTASLDAVTMLTKMMKAKNYHFDESVLDTFLHLRLLSEFSLKASYNSVDKPVEKPFDKKTQSEARIPHQKAAQNSQRTQGY